MNYKDQKKLIIWRLRRIKHKKEKIKKKGEDEFDHNWNLTHIKYHFQILICYYYILTFLIFKLSLSLG